MKNPYLETKNWLSLFVLILIEIETLKFHYLSGVLSIKLLWLSDGNGCPNTPLLFLYLCISKDSYRVLSSGLNGLLQPSLAELPTDIALPNLSVDDGILQLVRINNNGIISHSISPITTKVGRNIDQYTLVLTNRWWWCHQH